MAICEYCRGIGTHNYGCPNFQVSGCICIVCEGVILPNEKYVELEDGLMHYDCLLDMSKANIVDVLGYEVKEM